MDVAFISFNTICGMERKYMNYSRLEIEKKQKELTSTSVKMQYRVKEWMRYCCVFGTVVFVLFFVFTAIGVVRGLVGN